MSRETSLPLSPQTAVAEDTENQTTQSPDFDRWSKRLLGTEPQVQQVPSGLLLLLGKKNASENPLCRVSHAGTTWTTVVHALLEFPMEGLRRSNYRGRWSDSDSMDRGVEFAFPGFTKLSASASCLPDPTPVYFVDGDLQIG